MKLSCHRPHAFSRRGFTLVEISVVLVLFALLSVAAAMTVRVPLGNSQRQLALSQIRSLDGLARQQAREGDKVTLEFDLQARTAQAINTTKNRVIWQSTFDGNLQLLRVLGTQSTSKTVRSVSYDRFGTSKTFAIELGHASGKAEWLLVLGATGQSYVGKSTETIYAAIKRERDDAD